MGFYGSCRDCIHCGEIFKCDGRDEYRCNVSGIYFNSMHGGNKCRHYVNAEEEYARQKRKNTEDAIAKAIYINMALDAFSSDNDSYGEDRKRQEHPGWDKFCGCVMAVCMIIGIVAAIFSSTHNSYKGDFEKNLEKQIYKSTWSVDSNDIPYLETFVKPPAFLSNETVCKAAYETVSGHNNLVYKYKKRSTLDEVKRATKLYAYFVEEFPIKTGTKQTGIVLLSANANSSFANKVRSKGALLIDNGKFATISRKTEIESRMIPESKIAPEKPGKWEKANVAKYTLSSNTGADEQWNIGTRVVIDNHGYVTCYSYDFKGWENKRFESFSVTERIVPILDYRITKYDGGGRLKEKLVLPHGIRVGNKTIYEIRKGNRLNVRERKGNIYLCNIPLRGGSSINVYLEESQFKPNSKRNWYLIMIPGTGKEMWVDGRNLRKLL